MTTPTDFVLSPHAGATSHQPSARPRQPLVHDAIITYSTPTQTWSARNGQIGAIATDEPHNSSIEGIYHSNVRAISRAQLTVNGRHPEHIATQSISADAVRFVSLLRELDGDGADPRVRLDRLRSVMPGSVEEVITVTSARNVQIVATLRLELTPEFAPIHVVKAGRADRDPELVENLADSNSSGQSQSLATWEAGTVSAKLAAPGGTLETEHDRVVISWPITLPPFGSSSVLWRITMTDTASVIYPAPDSGTWSAPTTPATDPRLTRWAETALGDLERLRATTAQNPEEVFLAAGAPWFFTLFGRDSIWAARFMLPLGTEIAASTLRILAEFQGTKADSETAEQPGKIMHELRPTSLTIPEENVTIPPLYYGTVDATPLWVCLLADAWRHGMPDSEVEDLLPSMEAALGWIRDFGDSDGDGFLEYIDTTGKGLANQGWKDSGDSIQWHDGRLAEGPIALCEVQGYAYEAVIGGAEILDHFARPGGDEWRTWAADLKTRFNEHFWVRNAETGARRYPAVALDAHKQRVDSLTSNIGHLLGTGILDPEGATLIAEHLVSPQMNSGFGLRTLSTDSAGYWPLSYHGGSVWTHDTAIAIGGLVREGFASEASTLVEGLLAAAESFDYRMPELHSGEAAADIPTPVPYPAACRPQAWSAAAAISLLGIATAQG